MSLTLNHLECFYVLKLALWYIIQKPLVNIINPLCFLDDQVKPLNHSHDLPPPGKKGRTYICSCMIFLRPTTGGKLIMKKWIEELQAQPWSKAKKSNDQPAFNWALNRTAGAVCCLCLLVIAFVVCSVVHISL